MNSLTEKLRAYADSIGVDRLGVTSADPPEDAHRYNEWSDQGFAGSMNYMTESLRRAKRNDPKLLLKGLKSIVMISVNYKPKMGDEPNPKAKQARYSWGRDYHKVLRGQLKKLVSWLEQESSEAFDYKIYVDTGPLLERSLAERAGLGFIGKNSCLIDTKLGSYTYLGALLLTLPLSNDSKTTAHCGTCTACLDACPTDAFVGPYQLDARKCISYHTLESHADAIPEAIAKNMENWVAGCDICQEVCPWNRKSPSLRLDDLLPRPHSQLDVNTLKTIETESFRERFKGSALLRAGGKNMRRNAAAAQPGATQVSSKDK